MKGFGRKVAFLVLSLTPMIIALFAGPVSASGIYSEAGDAAQTIAGAQLVNSQPQGTQLDAIQGMLEGGGADIFEIYLTGGKTFSATTAASLLEFNSFDMQLFLFDSAGLGVYANDDEPYFPPQATLPSAIDFTPVASGTYFLAIAGSGYLPLSSGGFIFPESEGLLDQSAGIFNAVGPFGPGGALPLDSWSSTSGENGAYEIKFTGAEFVVPEPSSLFLVAPGAGAFILWRWKAARSSR